MSTLKRLRDCGRIAVTAGGMVGLRCSDGAAGFSGLSTCASVWACPVCASKILTRRAEELASLFRAAEALGGSSGMATFTMRHREGQSLRSCWDALSYAWGKVTSGKRWKAEQAMYGLVGWVRAVEVTHGANGWHVHAHIVAVFDSPTSETAGRQLAEQMWRRWEAALNRRGFTAERDSGGLDYRSSHAAEQRLSDYLTKSQANEVTFGPLKKACGENRTPFQIVHTFQATGDADDLDLWHEWEQGSKGRRQITYSQGLRAWAQLAPEQDDEEIATEDLGTDDLLLMPADTWATIRWYAVDLLEAAERDGSNGARAWLDERGLAYLTGPPQPVK